MRVVIAEDLALLRDGLTRLLEAYGFEVVAAVADAVLLAEAIRVHEPDVAVSLMIHMLHDIDNGVIMPGCDTATASHSLLAHTRVVMWIEW